MITRPDCRHFDGYRPCRYLRPCDGCPHYDRPASRILLVNLDALGDVLRTTALLGPLHRANPGAHVTWLTSPRAAPLLRHVPGVDRVLELGAATATQLRTLEFDLVLGVDKSLAGGALATDARAAERRGFGIDKHGSIVPFNADADVLYQLGLDDEQKFVHNRKPETRLLCEAMGWPWRRDPYRVVLSEEERQAVARWRADVADRVLVGINTGSSDLYPLKRLGAEDTASVVDLVARRCPNAALALLGGPEDRARNRQIAELVNAGELLETPTDGGLRLGLQMVAACDVVVTGDSLGMHMAIGLGKPTVAWFGLSCHQEIDLYGRGAWVLADVGCRPCWKRRCERDPLCTQRVPVEAVAAQTARIVETLERGDAWDGEHLVGSWPTWPRT